jgi:bifunctional ADP-heptose synthase (sugar kinase/adenylyltransferase)
LREGLGVDLEPLDDGSLREASEMLRERLSHHRTLITLGPKGIYVEDADGGRSIPAEVRSIADVSGAGDTVVSVAALCTAAGTDPISMAVLANIAGGLVCEEVGVVPIDKEKLLKEALEAEFPS